MEKARRPGEVLELAGLWIVSAWPVLVKGKIDGVLENL